MTAAATAIPTAQVSQVAPLDTRVGIPGQFSVFIHLWRTLAMVSVFLGHATYPDILFDVDFSLIGRANIPTFLMISGYFTAMSFANGGRFWKKIAKRYFNMLVIFVPASVLVLLMDIYMIDVGAIITTRDKFDPDLSLSRIAVDVFNLMTFSGEYWRTSTAGQGIFSNEATWFMDYMMAFTWLTAVTFMLNGGKRIAGLVLVAVVIGPKVLLLYPLWFAGIAAYELHRRALVHRGSSRIRHVLARLRMASYRMSRERVIALSWIMIGAAIALWISIEYFSTGASAYSWSKSMISYDMRGGLGMSKRFLWQWCYIPSLLIILVFSRFVLTGEASPRWAKVVGIASKYTLPVYAIHFTLMYFIQSLIPGYVPSWTNSTPYLMIVLTFIASIGFGFALFSWVQPVSDRIAARVFS